MKIDFDRTGLPQELRPLLDRIVIHQKIGVIAARLLLNSEEYTCYHTRLHMAQTALTSLAEIHEKPPRIPEAVTQLYMEYAEARDATGFKPASETVKDIERALLTAEISVKLLEFEIDPRSEQEKDRIFQNWAERTGATVGNKSQSIGLHLANNMARARDVLKRQKPPSVSYPSPEPK